MYYYRRRYRFSIPPSVASLIFGIIFAFCLIYFLDQRLSPVVSTMAMTQVNNLLTETITNHILDEKLDYGQFISIERNEQNEITALTTNMSAMNHMRSQLVSTVLDALNEVDISVVEVPLGSLLASDLFWAKGPTIQAKTMSVGTISAQFHSEFSHSGINQTLHRIYLQISVPIFLIMAGNTIETTIETQLCVSETIIVGVVPNTNLQMGTSLPATLFPSGSFLI